jgi:uncharacterized protein YndB with AHSA1/START domain
MKIFKPAHKVFEAFVDREKIGNFWFSSSSERWEQGKTITLRYDEYNAEGDINILEIVENNKIVYPSSSIPDMAHPFSISVPRFNFCIVERDLDNI